MLIKWLFFAETSPHNKSSKMQEKQKMRVLTPIIKFFAITTSVVPSLFALLLFAVGLDVYRDFVNFFILSPTFPTIAKFIRLSLMLLMTAEISKCLATGLSIGFLTVFVASTWLQRGNDAYNTLLQWNKLFAVINKFRRTRKISFIARVNCYKKYYIFWKLVNEEIMFYVTPPLIFFGCLLMIVCNYVSIGLFSRVNFFLYLMGLTAMEKQVFLMLLNYWLLER